MIINNQGYFPVLSVFSRKTKKANFPKGQYNTIIINLLILNIADAKPAGWHLYTATNLLNLLNS